MLRKHKLLLPKIKQVLMAACILIGLRMLFFLLGWRHTFRLLKIPINKNSTYCLVGNDIKNVEKIKKAVNKGCKMSLFEPTCLYRSLSLFILLRMQDIPASFVIGVRKDGERLLAHAWVEVGGVGLNKPKAEESFTYKALKKHSSARPHHYTQN